MMMQLQARVNFSCLKTFCTKNEHIYIYLYISGGFKIFLSSHRCARNFDIVKLKFFFTFLSCKIITHILTGFSITFLTHLKKDGHTLLGLSSKVFT